MKASRRRKLLLWLLLPFIGVSYAVVMNLLMVILGAAPGQDAVDVALAQYFESKQWILILIEAVIAPVVEEWLFRKLLYGLISRKLKKILAAVIVSVLFGVLHFSIPGMIYGFLFGLLLTWVLEVVETWLAAVLVHGMANLFSIFMNYVPSANAFVSAYRIAFLIAGVVVLGGCLFLLYRLKPGKQLESE
ncbi:MAG: CPBP family intramembrane metalloprotease [Lachnospiraceae bacterium]|nr:CPBP family intramembrane metalloprotease [Lachnospiraceae bacterium]